MAKEMKSWGTIVRVFRRYIIAVALSAAFIEAAMYVGMHSCSPYLMFPYILMGSVTGLYAIVGTINRSINIDITGWPEMESCKSCARLESRLSSVIDDRNSLHKALAELKVE